MSSSSLAQPSQVDENHVSVATQTVLLDVLLSSHPSAHRVIWSEWLGGFLSSKTSSAPDRDHFAEFTEVDRELVELRLKMKEVGADWNVFVSPGMDAKLKQLEKKHRKL